ncbi:MAG TPA: DUF5777 family beta-barrel protein [Bacteroidales bacterium]|nr:DUF5777 family beta-barrel protein [Bacteroidales bacterium]
MNRKAAVILLSLLLIAGTGRSLAQGILDMMDDDTPKTEYAFATFKATRVIMGQSVENTAKGELNFLIEHNFGRVNLGPYEFFGLDQANMRLGLDYGVNDWLNIGVGRSSYQKTFDGLIKARILRQSSGKKNMPVTVSWYSNIMLNSTKWQDTGRTNYFSSRLSYTAQLLIARKFSNAFSLQLMPTYIHKNLVPRIVDQNDIFALGAGARVKITQRTSLTGEYYYLLPGQTADDYQNCLSLGVDLETGGHVFQLRISNAQPMFERGFITETSGKWSKGDIYFGFTINRVFTIVKPKE